MKRQIGKRVIAFGKKKWTCSMEGVIVGIGDPQHYIVKYENGKTAWIKKEEIFILS